MATLGTPTDPSFLARLGQGLGNNQMALLGLAGGLLGGQGFSGGFDRMALGSKIDQSNRYLQADLAKKKKAEEDAARQKEALIRALGPELVDQLGISGAADYVGAKKLYDMKPKPPEDRYESFIDPASGIEYQTNKRTGQKSILNKPGSERPTFDIRPIKMPDGSERMVRIDRATGAVSPVEMPDGPSGGSSGTNPYATGKFNESQGKAATYADRIAQAEDIFSGPVDEKTGKRKGGVAEEGTSLWNQNIKNLPGIGNYMVTPEFRKFDQAQRNFINATLRRESGAVISEAEFDNARRQYLPQPGDDPETLAQKAENRRATFEGIAREAGSAYRPPAGYLGKQTGGDGAPRKVSSQAEWQALPRGTRYIAPDGSERVKQ